MSKKFGLIILVLLTLLLSACTISSSGPPTATPPKKNNNNVQASPTVNPMAAVEAAGTGTAAAEAGIPLDSTPAPDGIDATEIATPLGGIQQPPADSGLPTTTPNAPVIAQPTLQTVRPATYTLHNGEFIFCLARRFDVDPDQTLALNGLVDSQTIYAGLTVQIPATGSFPGTRALRAHPATYTVQTGDTIYSVACLYGDVDPANIVAVNGLEAPYDLTVGAQILVP